MDESDGAKSIGLSFVQLISLLVTFPIAWSVCVGVGVLSDLDDVLLVVIFSFFFSFFLFSSGHPSLSPFLKSVGPLPCWANT